MSNPPQDPGSVPRLRARAKVSGSVRPEVAQALGQVEQSLGDVARWERVLADEDPDATLDPRPVIVPPVGPPEAEDPSLAFRVDRDEPTLLTEFADPAAAAGPGAEQPVLVGARTVDPPAPAGPPPPPPAEDEDLARRRRNGRILSWAGVMILVGVAALWLIPDRSSDDGDDGERPALEETTSSTRRTSLLPPVETTAVPTTTATTVVDVAPTTAATTATTRPRSTTTTRAPAATTPTTAGTTTSTLGLPTDPCPAGCPTPRTTPPSAQDPQDL